MKHSINIDTWDRKEYFEWFNSFDEPFWSITVDIECTGLYKKAKLSNMPVSLYIQHCILRCVNTIEEFRYRIENKNVVTFDKINISPVIARDDHSFGCSIIEYDEDIDIFIERSLKVQEYVKSIKGLNMMDEDSKRLDTIHYSTHPWTQFTGLTRTRRFNTSDSIPKISTGKFYQNGDKLMLPICVAAHHGFVDGYHTGMLCKNIEEITK